MAVIRQRTQVFNRPFGVVRGDAGGARVGEAIGQVADSISQIAFNEAADYARKKGIDLAEAAEEKNLRTMNPDTGKPEAFTAPDSFGRIAAESYQRVIDKRFEDSMSSELRIKSKEIASKYQFDPETYTEVMKNYIGEMSENATGKYKVFIEETGSEYLALTKINIQNRARERARANAAQSVITSIDQKTDDIFDLARAGGFIIRDGEEVSEVTAGLTSEVVNVRNAINANLLKPGADLKANDQLNAAIAKGGVEYLLSKTASSVERNAINLAIATRGAEIDGVPSNLRGEVKQLLQYVNASNATQTLSHFSNIAADYNAVERDILEQQKAVAVQVARRSEVMFSDSMTDFSAMSTNYAAYAFDSDQPMSVTAYTGIANNTFNKVKGVIDQRYQADTSYTEEQRKSDLRDARQTALRPFLIQAAAEGNVEELRIAINTRDPKDLQMLTAKQQEVVTALYQSDFFDASEDIKYAREVLSASKNTIREQRDAERLKFEISTSVTEAGELAETGGLSDKAFENLVTNIKGNIGPKGLSAKQAESEIARLTKQRALGVVEIFSARATSADLNNLATYVDSGGQRTEGMSPDVIAAGNRILEQTKPDQRDAVVSKISGLKTTIKSQEDELNEALKARNNQLRILGGNGNVNSKEDRNFTQEILDNNGIKLENFYDLNEQTQLEMLDLMRSAAPQGLIDNLNRMASGLPVEEARTYLSLFATLSNDPTEQGLFINRFGNALSAETVELLEDANQIRVTMGGDANTIITTLVERQRDPKSTAQMNAVLGDKTPTDYATAAAGDDFVVGAELAPVVEYLARTGKSKKEIDARLESLIDRAYPKSTHIADPRFPAGSIKRSRHSLQAHFPVKEERNAFIAAVESQLPSGYALIPNMSTLPDEFTPPDARLRADEKKVMLVPDESTAGVNYFAYYIDESNELRPLIYEKDGQAFWPTFNRDDIADYYEQAAIRRKEELDKLEETQQGVFKRTELLKKRPGFR
jgi:hypothetical protein